MHRRDLLALAGAFVAAPALAQTAPTTPPTPAAPAAPRTVRVNVETGQGVIVIELYVDQAPITTANFLRYVDQKRYDGATFFRASRSPGPVDYGLIQGGLQGDPARVLKPIAHEPTTQTVAMDAKPYCVECHRSVPHKSRTPISTRKVADG